MSISSLNWADYIIIGIISFSILISIIRGFVREAMSLATWIIAIWVGITFSSLVAAPLKAYITTDVLRSSIAFFILFAITLIIGTMISFLVTQVIRKTGLSGTDRILGIVFGMARGGLVVAMVILVATLTSAPQDTWWQHSALIPHFKPMAAWLHGFFPAEATV